MPAPHPAVFAVIDLPQTFPYRRFADQIAACQMLSRPADARRGRPHASCRGCWLGSEPIFGSGTPRIDRPMRRAYLKVGPDRTRGGAHYVDRPCRLHQRPTLSTSPVRPKTSCNCLPTSCQLKSFTAHIG